MNEEFILRLRDAGVPDPDGSALGDVAHTLAVHHSSSDDTVVLMATKGVYGDGDMTGISLGDLRVLYSLALLGSEFMYLALRSKSLMGFVPEG